MKKLHEDKIVPITINLNVQKDQINESFLRMFGHQIELLLKRMFGLNELDFNVRGPSKTVNKFLDTIRHEKDHIRMLGDLGLFDQDTWNSKYKLDRAVREFESTTGIKWPIK